MVGLAHLVQAVAMVALSNDLSLPVVASYLTDGCVAGTVPWLAIWWYILGAGEVPGFVYAITVSQLLLFTGFALNQALQYARVGRWRSYLFGEAAYIVLSLAAKSLLAWLIFGNVLRT